MIVSSAELEEILQDIVNGTDPKAMLTRLREEMARVTVMPRSKTPKSPLDIGRGAASS